jgi:hypothetical protein
MVRRYYTPVGVSILALAVVVACIPTTPRRAAQLTVGQTAPAVLAKSENKVQVVWAFSTRDLLSCESPALALRHLKARFGADVHLVAVAVGEDPGIVNSFMARERLDPQVIRMREPEFERAFLRSKLPALYVVRDHRIAEATSDSIWSDGSLRRVRTLESVVRSLLPHSGYAVQQ